MKKLAALLVLASGVLGGCGIFIPYDGPDPTKPFITFETVQAAAATPQFAVTPLELVFKKREQVTITWSLDPKSNLRFARNGGIQIEGEVKYDILTVPAGAAVKERPLSMVSGRQSIVKDQDQIVNCKVSEDQLTATCLNRHTRAGQFKYSVRLTDGTNDYVLDPPMNNW